MSYREALEAAGAEVLAFKEFGSYQGDWIAKVSYEGDTFFIRDYYGSCSGCDAFEAEVGYDFNPDRTEYTQRVAAFGKEYLEPSARLTYEQVLAKASENISWDSDAEDMVKFVESIR
jgi:hypothetical protein